MSTKLYENITDSLVSDGYVIIKNTLNPSLVASLSKFAKDEKNYKIAGISSTKNLTVDNSKRRDRTLWLDEDSGVQSEYLEFCNGLRKYLNKSLYLGLTFYESHFAIYDKGDFYEKHLDSFRGEKNRIVTTVFYLNKDWDKENGGELLIYDENGTPIETVIPNENTLVVFLSDKFPHEVLPSMSKRHSIAGWFRVD